MSEILISNKEYHLEAWEMALLELLRDQDGQVKYGIKYQISLN